MARLAMVVALVLAVIAPAAASARQASDNDFANGVTSYLWVYYNTQVCDGGFTKWQIYKVEYRWYRTDTGRSAKDADYAAGNRGYSCSRIWLGEQSQYVYNFPPAWCFTDCHWTRTYTHNYSWQYAGGPDSGFGDVVAGAYVASDVYVGSTYQTKICPLVLLAGDLDCVTP